MTKSAAIKHLENYNDTESKKAQRQLVSELELLFKQAMYEGTKSLN